MSQLAQAALISGSIFAIVMVRGYGRRAWDKGAVIFPALMVAGFGYGYLHEAPTGAADLAVYAVALALGVTFGGLATLATRLERDNTGRLYAVTGLGFVTVWLVAVAARLGFIWAVENIHSFRMSFGEFMITHHVDFAAIAPFFVLWALAMVATRVAAVVISQRRVVPAVATV